jgi:hypothetical protein
MDPRLRRVPELLLLFAAMLLGGIMLLGGPVSAADVAAPASAEAGAPAVRPNGAKRQMSPRVETAQFRCPGGQLVFLTRACGCNGACCACAANARYLNHCTCQCEAVPTPCTKGHSAGTP